MKVNKINNYGKHKYTLFNYLYYVYNNNIMYYNNILAYIKYNIYRIIN